MNPTDILSSEHRVIEVILDCLERLTEVAREKGRLDKEAADQIVDFVRTFADECHHGKEENQLFTTLEEKGMPRQGGPLGQMVLEHEQGRAFVTEMAACSTGASEGDTDALDSFVQNAQGYIRLLRAHILKEDQILFPMADRILSDADQQGLLAAFEKVESQHMGHGIHAKYLRLAEQLADKLGVSKKGLADRSQQCGH